MKLLSFIVTCLGAVKLKDTDRQTVLNASKLNQLQIRSNGLYLLGIDSIYQINNQSHYTKIDLPSDEKSLRKCERVGGTCRNHVNHVFDTKDATFACGSDSGHFTCVNIDDPRGDRFHARTMGTTGHVIKSVGDHMILAAGSDGIQKSRFNSRKVVTVGEALTTQKVPSQVLSSLVTATTHYYIGRRWDAGRESWIGFVSSLCLNDPGALSDSRKLISTVRRDISCCDGAGCYHNLVAAVNIGESDFVGIFHDQFNQTSSVCQFGQDDLADLFSSTNYESRERTPIIEGKTANLAQCQIYDKIKRDVHQALSDFSSADMDIVDTYNRESVIPQREGQVRHVAVETMGRNSVVVLVYHNRIEKYSITDKWRWNIELYSTVGQNSKSVALFKNQLYVVNGHGLESVNMDNCAYYRKEGTCLIVKDVTCGWNQQDNLCQLVTKSSSFRAPVPGLILQSRDQIEIESTVVQKKAIDGTVTLVADTSNDVYDNLEWFDPSQNKLEENETPNYTWFKGANKTQLLIYDTTKYSGFEKLRFTLHYNIRNETTKMVIFEIGYDSPSTPLLPMPTSVTNAEIKSASLGGIVPIIVGIIGVLVIFIIIAIFVFISRTLPKRRRRQSSKKFHLSGSKQASILDSDQSFILHSPDLFERERNTARFEYSIPIDRSGINNSKPDQESFKSDYMSCSSKDLSSSNSEVDQMPKPDEAIIVFPDGTIGRLKANKLKKLKSEIDDLKLEDGEKVLAGTLKRSRRK